MCANCAQIKFSSYQDCFRVYLAVHIAKKVMKIGKQVQFQILFSFYFNELGSTTAL